MSSDGSKAVKLANEKTAKQLSVALKNVDQLDAYGCRFSLTGELSESNRGQIWTIIEENMKELYITSSMGWNPPEKKEELFNPLARFILITSQDHPDQIAGYSAFRFEHEEEEDLVYCYEIQISRSHQRKGIGKFLVKLLEAVGQKFRMEKIMLTALDKNAGANDFYNAMGFQLDPSSPTYHEDGDEDYEEDENVDYQILSKVLV
ncbi:acyl-CoA N-acyltransferase [Gymnopus androsaceus JB14]|uniref:N-alpha-acetyltransferase 40 n=1 Tax=Gymnopus androsaceus JB14 TaxID=1447944 RepID=A0A6A4ITI7_9AGAR|nr:acyl-CoA N-acyltransferase [Gymnopus androsaceus JB14]